MDRVLFNRSVFCHIRSLSKEPLKNNLSSDQEMNYNDSLSPV